MFARRKSKFYFIKNFLSEKLNYNLFFRNRTKIYIIDNNNLKLN